ncbi:MAG: PqqD family protein [Deltaproteobacteria bacterium]|nr:PqqD family protein [Deltaproteobacteria bacterium]
MADIKKSRRSFVCRIMGLISGILLANPKELRAAKLETRDLLEQLELDILRRSRPIRNPSMTCRESEKGITLYVKENGKETPLYLMNSTGYMIWKACDGSRSFKQISRLIREKYRVPGQKAQLDALLFLSQLKKSKAITVTNYGV